MCVANKKNCYGRDVALFPILFALVCALSLWSSQKLAGAQSVNGSWNITGSLNTARSGHTATLLPNGKVLIAGGEWNSVLLKSAELYDPSTGSWALTGNLNIARAGHTATLLPNGKVLITGANNTDNVNNNRGLNSAEIYDPATGIWSNAANLNRARRNHTATLLASGKVLVVGGDTLLGHTTELYDPAADTWTLTGNLNTSRAYHTATRLNNGQVLVTAGFLGGNTAELYDPASGEWTLTSNLNDGGFTSGRTDHLAVLLPGGKVLVAGGEYYVCGGDLCDDSWTEDAELYDPLNRTWSTTTNVAIATQTATLLSNGKVLALAGRSANLYDPITGQWSPTTGLNIGFPRSATLLQNGQVLVTEGSTAELYNPGSSTSNDIDRAEFFVTQHYRDFLNREPDADGLAFWTNEITSCGTDAGCIEAKRINVSGAFFISIEFQETGYLVYRIRKAAYGNFPPTPVPVRFNEFISDTRDIGHDIVVGAANWEAQLELNKQTFVADFVSRPRFIQDYPLAPFSMEPAEFVDALLLNAGVSLTRAERASLINEFPPLGSADDLGARARVLRRIVENENFKQQEFNRDFVLMQYFGYLRRNPDDPPELTRDFQGYNFWLGKLDQFHGNFVDAEMVKAFLVSTEYRQRFGAP